MNVQTNPGGSTALAMPDAEIMRVLGSSLYPGAKPESIALVMSYCKAARIDPLLKAVHIVPMSVKDAKGGYSYRDVIMPGIAHYRLQASRSGEYVGKTEPEFGPDQVMKVGNVDVTYPKWCKVTVRRKVGSSVAEFTATEFWLENYATAKRDSAAPNAMWQKRPYGQLQKCAEAQALRMAFPELIGGGNTAEELEGKEIDEATMRDITPTAPSKTEVKEKRKAKAEGQLDGFAGGKSAKKPAASGPDGDVIEGEVMPPLPELPSMPDEALEAMKSGRWGHAWKWFQATIYEVDPLQRQSFADAHADVIGFALDGSDNVRAALAELAADAGFSYEEGQNDD